MTHNEKRSTWQREALASFIAGSSYGLTSITVGQPLDTIKTRMQAKSGYDGISVRQAAWKILRNEGPFGFYRGSLPMFCGSVVYRASQFAVFEAVYTFCEPYGMLTATIPATGGLQPRVLLGGLAGGTVRSIIECPFEFMKVNQQVVSKWSFRDAYTGLGVTIARTAGMFTVFVMLLDSGRRHLPDLWAQPLLGPFLLSGGSSAVSWWTVWPLERVKSTKQARYVLPDGRRCVDMSTWQVLRAVLQREGLRGLYRGIVPGTMRCFLANGTSMTVMYSVNKQISKWGLRGPPASS